MLHIVTGQPGNGKTLFAISTVRKLAKAQGRPVFYHGIDLTEQGREVLGWTLLEDATEWASLPPASIVVIDEAQKVFRVRPAGSQVPSFVSALETHRHLGIDLYLLTQHPHLIDTHVRKLTGRQYHLVRKFGGKRTNVYQFESCRDTPEKCLSQGMHSSWTLDPAVYPLYKSAELHTVKSDFPLRYVFLFVGAAAVAAFGLLFTYHHFKSGGGIEGIKHEEGADEAHSAAAAAEKRLPPPFNPWSAELRAPRLEDVPESAPFYDPLQRVPRTAPRVAGCMSMVIVDDKGVSKIDCSCHTWQGSRIPMSVHRCKMLMRDGWFDPYRTEPTDTARRGVRPEAGPPASADAANS